MSATGFSSGESLVELLLAIAVLALLLAAVQRFAGVMLHGARELEVASEAQEAAMLAVQMLVGDLRAAGYSPGGRLRGGLQRAEEHALGICSDWNGDGDRNDSNERVEYSFDRKRRRLMRRMGGAPPQPMLEGLDAEGLRLTYFSADGGLLSGARGSLGSVARRRVDRVDVRIGIAMPHPDPTQAGMIRAEQTGTAYLRNARIAR